MKIICKECKEFKEHCAKGICQKCYDKKRRLENPEKIRTSQRRWEAKNREKIRLKKRKYRFENLEKIKAKDKKYYIKNKEKIRIKNKKYRLGNLGKIKILQKKWGVKKREENPWMFHYFTAKCRCENPNVANYKYYGAKGVEFKLTREEIKFLYLRDDAKSMKRPSIDRIYSDGNYIFGNCRFIELSENVKKAWRERRLRQNGKL